MIREVIEADWERVKEIYNYSIMEGKATFQTEEYTTYKKWSDSHEKKCRLVIIKDDFVVGWCALSETSSKKTYSGVVEVSIYLDHKFSNLGLGTKLMKALCEESEKSGYWCLYSSIFPYNIGSINIHKKCGFREIGYREKIAKDRFGVWQDVILLELRNGNY